MSTDLFREEALEYFARPDGPGELVQLSDGRMSAIYLAFLVLVLAGLLVSLVVQIDGQPLLHVLLFAFSDRGAGAHG